MKTDQHDGKSTTMSAVDYEYITHIKSGKQSVLKRLPCIKVAIQDFLPKVASDLASGSDLN